MAVRTARWIGIGRRVVLVVAGCWLAGVPAAEAGPLDGTWGARFSPTSRGTLLVNTNATADVSFFDPSVDPGAVRLIQAGTGMGSLANVDVGSGFTLGSGAAASQVIGAWRRGTDFAWVWRQTIGSAVNGTPALVTATARQGGGTTFNPEWMAIADGCVFMVLQFPIGGTNVKDIYRVDPATGAATLLTGALPVTTGGGVANTGAARVVTSGCQAAFTFDPTDLATSADSTVRFYNGTSVVLVDAGEVGAVHLSRGRVVYTKVVGGIPQVFLYDSTAASPGPVALTASAGGINDGPRTDGRHVVWIHEEGGVRNVVLNGGVVLTADPATRPAPLATDPPDVQLDRGQLLWKGANGALYYVDAGGLRAVDIRPETTFSRQFLADGVIAYQTPTTNFLVAGTPPGTPTDPPPPLRVVATPGAGQVQLAWDRVVGASSYFVYVALEPGLTRANWMSRRGGRKIAVTGPPFTLTGLTTGRTHQILVTAVAGGVESAASAPVSATLFAGTAWQAGAGTAGIPFEAVAADPLAAGVAYAGSGSGVHKTTDGGASWAALGGGVAGQDVRALSARGGVVLAVTAAGDIFRSLDAGASWTLVADGTAPRGPFMSIARDPLAPNTLYAGPIELASGGPGDSFVLKSVNGGATWSHQPPAPIGLPGDLIPYAIGIDSASAGTLHVAGSGEAVARSTDGGASWTSMDLPVPNFPESLALDPRSPTTLYVGTRALEQNGVYKSYGDQHWTQVNAGLGAPLPQVDALLVDPSAPSLVQAGTTAGYFYSADGGLAWTALNTGLPGGTGVAALAMLPTGDVLAATAAGMFRLALAVPAGIRGIVTGAGPGAGSHVRGFAADGTPTALSFLVYPAGFVGGVRLATGDVNGGGALELITAAGPGGGPHIRVFVGATAGTVLTEFLAYDPGFTNGLYVAAGDVDGDGRAEIITGVSPGGGPHVRVFRVTPLAELTSFFAYDPGFTGGITVAACDVNGDGRADVVTGAGPGGGPHVQVFDGVTASVLRSFLAYDPGLRAGIFVACGDVDGDGVGDIATGVGAGGGPHVQVISGATGASLASFFAYDPGATVGMRVALADLDGDGRAEIITAPGTGGGPHVKVFRRNPDGSVTETAGFFAYDPGFLGGVFVSAGR
jgi:hypothetical protein